jgi:hypothetical protein
MRYSLPVLAAVLAIGPRARAAPIALPTAAAETVPTVVLAELPDARFAVAVNAPLGWLIGSFGASAYVRLGDHVALRGNVAKYQSSGGPVHPFAAFNPGSSTGYGGSIVDAGISAIWYPRHAWEGILLEAGFLRRGRDTYVWPETEEKTFTRSTEYAGHALIGWSWLIRDHVVFAIAAGLSRGHESGHDTTMPYESPLMTSPVHRWQIEPEGYTRLGWVF